MSDVLETLREVDRYFQKKSGRDVPEQVVAFKDMGGYHQDRRFQYDLWRRVRAAIKELENGRSGSAGQHCGDGGPITRPAPGAANSSDAA